MDKQYETSRIAWKVRSSQEVGSDIKDLDKEFARRTTRKQRGCETSCVCLPTKVEEDHNGYDLGTSGSSADARH
eukprot:9162068-Karenia_brevis.AAC.1